MNNYSNENRILGSVIMLLPLFVFSSNLVIGLTLGAAFLIINSATFTVSLVFPVTDVSEKMRFWIALFVSAISSSLVASLVRIIDPLLYETTADRIFLIAFITPIVRAALPKNNASAKEKAGEDIMLGFVYAVMIVLFGTLRQLFASGSVSIVSEVKFSILLPVFGTPTGAFLFLALLIALSKFIVILVKGNTK